MSPFHIKRLPGTLGRSMKVKHILFLVASIILLASGEKTIAREGENMGLGPLEIRDQFPVAFPYLIMTPAWRSS